MVSTLSKQGLSIAKSIDKYLQKNFKAGMNIPKKDIRYKFNIYPSLAVFVWVAIKELGYDEQHNYIVVKPTES